VAGGLWPVEVGVQVKAQVPLEDGADLRWCVVRGEVVRPAASVDTSDRWAVSLATVIQQHVGGVHAGNGRAQVPVSGHGRCSLTR